MLILSVPVSVWSVPFPPWSAPGKLPKTSRFPNLCFCGNLCLCWLSWHESFLVVFFSADVCENLGDVESAVLVPNGRVKVLADIDRDVAEQSWKGGGGEMFGHKRRLKTVTIDCNYFTCAMYEAARERPPTVTPSFLEEKFCRLSHLILIDNLQQALIAW